MLFRSAGAGGAYSLDLTWDQLDQAQSIGFDKQGTRSLSAEFYDTDGNKVSSNLDLTLTCGGDPACAGKCLKAGALCSGSSTQICVAGACSDGCYIGGSLRTPNATNPDPDFGTCQKCDTSLSRSSWTNAAAGTACGTRARAWASSAKSAGKVAKQPWLCPAAAAACWQSAKVCAASAALWR